MDLVLLGGNKNLFDQRPKTQWNVGVAQICTQEIKHKSEGIDSRQRPQIQRRLEKENKHSRRNPNGQRIS
tara:strand:+ start:1090 stop:1299 length:210 start_codon:yes stop_codon:yes gene_type:complete